MVVVAEASTTKFIEAEHKVQAGSPVEAQTGSGELELSMEHTFNVEGDAEALPDAGLLIIKYLFSISRKYL